jgi:hypothetical protein
MRQHMLTAVAAVAAVFFLVGSAPAQESSATIRTYQGVTYKVADLTLEVFYSIGEPKSMEGGASAGSQPFTTMINVLPAGGGGTGGAEQAAAGGGAGEEKRVLSGHSRASDITVSNRGVTTRIAWDQIRALRFARKPVTDAGLQLPPYIPYFKYSASVSLVSGEQMEGDYVNLGGTIVRGTASTGRVDIPWEAVEYILFDR